TVAARHPVLRTSFHWDEYSEPMQVVHRSATLAVAVDDLRSMTPAAQDDAIVRWLEAEKASRFDPAVAPLFRIHVHRRGETDLQLTASFHHAILDGWSFATVMSELVAAYLDGLDGHTRDVTPPAVSGFSEFVALEREALESSASQGFWSAAVADLPETT